jgi:hypothetical protein
MKNWPCIIVAILLSCSAIIACKKTAAINAPVLFYNATYSLPSFTVSWNNGQVLTNAITPGHSTNTADSPYVEVPGGTNLVTLKVGANTLFEKNIYTPAGFGNSFFLYDTGTVAGAAGILQMSDDFTVPDTASINYRLLDLCPDPSVLADVWLVHGTTDSVNIATSTTFIGQDAAGASYQAFNNIKYHNEQYTIKVKNTGTEQLFASINMYPFVVRGLYTIVFSGTAATGFKLTVLHNHI